MGNMPTCDIAIIIVCAGRHGTTERRAGAPGMNASMKIIIDNGSGVQKILPLDSFTGEPTDAESSYNAENAGSKDVKEAE